MEDEACSRILSGYVSRCDTGSYTETLPYRLGPGPYGGLYWSSWGSACTGTRGAEATILGVSNFLEVRDSILKMVRGRSLVRGL
ncbi:MAG: hypothetical protein QW220_03690 [Candidatus Bathyarchaeia archaeon]